MVSESVPAPESLEAELERLRAKSKRDDATIERLEKEVRDLSRRLDQFIRNFLSGKKGEAIDPKQLELALQGLAGVLVQGRKPDTSAAETRPEAPRRERQPRRALDADGLETRQTVIEPEEVAARPEGWTRIGEERTVQLDYQPGKLFRHEIVRPRYVKNERFALAALPAQPIDKGMVGAGLLAWLLSGKYVDHLPLYRMAEMFRRQQGVEIPRNTMSGWVDQSVELLKSIYRAMVKKLGQRNYLQVDETTTRYLDPEEKKGSRQGYFWVYNDPGGEVVFQWDPSRSHEVPLKFLGEFRGVVQVDGYGGYEALERKRSGQIVLAHCWAHVRRDFIEAEAEAPRPAAWVLRQIQLLYAVEAGLRKQKAGPVLKEARRAAGTTMILKRLKRGLERLRGRTLPGGGFSKAIEYVLTRWDGLSRFARDGRVAIDNNGVENAIRPCAIGRKNWLFVGSPEAGDHGAVVYSLVASCRRHGVDPYEYLRDVLTRLPGATTSQVEGFTPAEWAKKRKQAD